MIFVTRIETVSLAEIPPPCFLTSGFIQRQYPLHDLCFYPYVFTLLEYRKRSYWAKTKRRLSSGRSPEPPHTQGPDPSEQPLWPHALRPPLFASTPPLAPPPRPRSPSHQTPRTPPCSASLPHQ